MHIHAAALALTATLVPFAAYAQDPPARTARRAGAGRRRRPWRPAHRSRRFGPTIASSPRKRSPTRASSPFTGSRTGSTTRFPRTSSGKSSSGSARSPRRRSAPATAGRRPATASCKWERRGDRILLRSVSYEVVADRADADRAGGPGRELRLDPDGLQHRGAGQGRRAGDRGDAPLHDRRARVQRPDPRAARGPSTPRARSSSAPSRSPRTSRSKPRTPTTIRRTQAGGAAPAAAGRPARGATRPHRQRQRRHALQHGACCPRSR